MMIYTQPLLTIRFPPTISNLAPGQLFLPLVKEEALQTRFRLISVVERDQVFRR